MESQSRAESADARAGGGTPSRAAGDAASDVLRRATSARLAVGRAGTRPRTGTWLDFRADHAKARDAVNSELSQAFVDKMVSRYGCPVLQSAAADRTEFILNPPKGKLVDAASLQKVKELCLGQPDVQIVLSDGLAAAALETNAPDVLALLLQGLRAENINAGTLVLVRYGRVAVADPIAHVLGARMVVNLIGERPGLSAVGLSAYLTYNPGPHTISSDRTVVSNIHKDGTPPVEAGAYLVKLCRTILKTELSGVKLQQSL